MDEQLYVVVDIHPDDACSESPNDFIGQIVTIRNVKKSKAGDGYLACDAEFIKPLVGDDGQKTAYMFFYGVQLQTIEDNRDENGRIVEP